MSASPLPLPPLPLTSEDPAAPPAGIVPLGRLVATGDLEGGAAAFGVPNSALNRHMLICGNAGTGKSELLTRIAMSLLASGQPQVIFDLHGHLTEDLLDAILARHPDQAERLVLCDLDDRDYPVQINPLMVSSVEAIEPVVATVMEMLAAAGLTNAPRAITMAAAAVSVMCEANLKLADRGGLTIAHLPTFFEDEELRRLTCAMSTNPVALAMFDPEDGPYEMAKVAQQRDMVLPIVRAVQTLARAPHITSLMSGENRLNFPELIDAGKTVIVRLGHDRRHLPVARLFGTLLLPWLAYTIDEYGRRRDPESGEQVGSGLRILIDDMADLLHEQSALTSLLAESRKWDVGVIGVIRSLDDVPDQVGKGLLSNVATKVSFAADGRTGELMARAMHGQVKLADIAAQPNYAFYANVLLPSPSGGHQASGPLRAVALESLTERDLSTLLARCGRSGAQQTRELRAAVIERSRRLLAAELDQVTAGARHYVGEIKSELLTALQDRLDRPDDSTLSGFLGWQTASVGLPGR